MAQVTFLVRAALLAKSATRGLEADADPVLVPDQGGLGRPLDGSSRKEIGATIGRPTAGQRRTRGWVRSIVPELVSGASDNDPTNVATATAVGAATGYQLAWLVLLVAPLLGIVQTIAAHVGSVGCGDLQTLTLKRYGRRVAAVLLVSVVVVNVVTIAADLQAGAAGIGLLTGVDSRWLVPALGSALIGLLLVGKYDQMIGVLRYLLLGFLAFAVAAYLAHPDWPRVIRASLIPTLSLRHDMVAELKIVYLRNVEQGSSDLEFEACGTLDAMSSPRHSGMAPR